MSRHITGCASDDYCGGSCVQTGIPATKRQERCPELNCGAAHDEDHTRGCINARLHLIPRDHINMLKAKLRYNSTDMGELGRWVRYEHVLNFIDDFLDRVEMETSQP